MTLKNLTIVIIVFFTITVTNTSCHKKNTSFNYSDVIETIADYVETQQMTDLLLGTYFKSINDSVLLTDSIAIIDSAQVILSSNPVSLEFNYNVGNNTDAYGHNRKGIYRATSNTNFTNPEAIITFTFENFRYDFKSITADSFILIVTGINGDNRSTFNLEATNVKRNSSDTTGSIVFSVVQKFIRYKDPGSIYYTANDYFEIEGNNEGVAKNGYQYKTSITEANKLNMNYSCIWLTGGNSQVLLPDFIHDAEVSFNNDGSCVNKYSIITNETLFEKPFD